LIGPIPRFRSLTLALVLSCIASRAPAASLDPSAWRGDARFLASAVDSIHPQPYRWHRRAEWDSVAAGLERNLPGMRYDQAVAGFSRLLGLLRDGHSRLDQLELPAHGRPVLAPLPGPGFGANYPFDCDVFANGLWITRARVPYAGIAGARIVAVHGVPVASAVARLAPLIPADNPMWTLYMLPAFLRSPGYAAAAGLASGPTGPLELTLADKMGRRREVVLGPERADSTARWIDADEDVREPLPLTRRLPGPFAFADLGDSAGTVFARIRAIVDEPGMERMDQFVARLFAHVDSLGSRRLVLDLRGNGGGNNYLNQPLVHALIRRPELDRTGRLFVIVDRGTFSAAVSLAADLQRETRALFVGEPTGAAPNSPGDPAHVTLPASGLVVRISSVLWQGSDPRDPRPFIVPDLPAMPAWADWIGHRDPALAAIDAWRGPADLPDAPPNTRWGSHAQLRAQAPRIDW
jgi:hypothetical protein